MEEPYGIDSEQAHPRARELAPEELGRETEALLTTLEDSLSREH